MGLRGQHDSDDHEKDDEEGDVKALHLPPLLPARVEALSVKSPNDAGSRQTTSFAAMSTRPSRLYVLPFIALACLTLGCGTDPSTPLTQDQAVAAAIDASDMSEPLAIVSTRAGIAGELWDGVRPSWSGREGQALDDYRRKLRRPAWLVVLDGTYPRGPERLELVIDRDTGEELFRHSPPFQLDQLFSGKR